MSSQPVVRVIVRLPYNRPENAPANPPRVEWNVDKEHILWEVIAKSRAVDGATDWKGLANHLQVPLPYLLYRAQVRYEEDLRGLQGLSVLTAARSPTTASATPSPVRPNGPNTGEYFPRVEHHTRPPLLRRDSTAVPHPKLGSSSAQNGTSTLRPGIGVRARLSSLGQTHGRALLQSQGRVQSPLGAQQPPGPSTTTAGKKVSSSSTLTLQGPKRARTPLMRLLSPAGSAGTSEEASEGEDDGSDDGARDEEAERQDALARKLAALEKLMTKDAVGLVAEPAVRGSTSISTSSSNGGDGRDRGRARPLSPRDFSMSHGRNQSLSSASVDSPERSIPDIPSPQAQSPTRMYPASGIGVRGHQRRHSQGFGYGAHPSRSASHSQSLSSLSQPRSNDSRSHSDPHSPVPAGRHRHISTSASTSTSASASTPDKQSPASARVGGRAGLNVGTPSGSEASSFSDLSDASVSQSALESALMSNVSNMSNIRSGGSRLSSFARSRLQGSKRPVRS